MKNKTVTLKSFLGTTTPKKPIEGRENYWKLIGQQGRIIDHQENDDRVLVLFDKNLDEFEIENHNPIKNSLWIKKSDLKFELK